MDEQDERMELYRRFETDILNSPQNVYFDENELIDIFDVASDANDDFVKMEVLWYGARLFPESTELAERKAYFYYELGNSDAAQKTIKRVPKKSILRRLLELRINTTDRVAAIAGLEELIKDKTDFSDEEIIQLVSTANDLGLYQWLKQHSDDIKKLTDYPQTFLYEMVNLAEMSEDYEYSVSMLEELTMLEPFNGEFWEMLAGIYVMYFGDVEKAMSAVDFALAINPDSRKARILKAQCMYGKDFPHEKIVELLDDLISADADDSMPVQYKAFLKTTESDNDAALEILQNYLNAHLGDKSTIDFMLTISDGQNMDAVLDKFYSHTDMLAEEQWVEWANAQENELHYGAASAILSAFRRNNGTLADVDRLIALAYRAKMYPRVVEVYTDHLMKHPDLPALSSISLWFYAMSRMRLNQSDGLVAILQDAFDSLTKTHVSNTVESHLQDIGIAFKLATMINILNGISTETIDSIDPYSNS